MTEAQMVAVLMGRMETIVRVGWPREYIDRYHPNGSWVPDMYSDWYYPAELIVRTRPQGRLDA
jgi:hypothetical protein